MLLNNEYYFIKDAIGLFTANTGIQLVKPMDFNSEFKQRLIKDFELEEIEKITVDYHKEHNVLTSEEMEKLLEKEEI